MEVKKETVRSILLIDDDQDDYELVLEAIQEINPSISVTFVNNCEQLLQNRKQSFDLILLDINMPHYDGFFLLKAIRDHGYCNMPIVMYTNSLSPAHIAKAYQEGANLFFSKPESYSGLISGLRKLIQLDWSSPYSITKNYCHGGNYRIFQGD